MNMKKIISAAMAMCILGGAVPLCGLDASAVSPESYYKEVLDMFYDNISTGWQDYDNQFTLYGIDASGTANNVSYMWKMYSSKATLEETWYKIIDINGDGIDELAIGTSTGYHTNPIFHDLYTLKDGLPVHIVASGERDSFSITNDGFIHESGSGGAGLHTSCYYTIEDGMAKPVEAYIQDYSRNPDNPNFYATEYEIETYSDMNKIYYQFINYINITEEQMNNQGHEEKILEVTPFSEYKKAGAGYSYGDISGDGIIDANDASLVLFEYSELSTGGKPTFDSSQTTFADINSDGLVDANDASIILEFYSFISTGGNETDIMKWFGSNSSL